MVMAVNDLGNRVYQQLSELPLQWGRNDPQISVDSILCLLYSVPSKLPANTAPVNG
ncbi:MAG: hypothetical protein Ct9H300mP4_03580 [Gammaproteobacteria bacterium]|nr:MAG: hypothetical protein Ct9H300mP4_03580 [Gammaproteobacteria bacterium]